jgi:Fe-S cluster assembly protein SufD
MVTASTPSGSYLEVFDELRNLAFGRDPVWSRNLREDAMAIFCESGFPTTRDEDWRFTNVASLAKTNFHRAVKDEVSLSAQDLEPYRLAGSGFELVFINGHFSPQFSTIEDLIPGVTVSNLAEAIRQYPERIESHLGRYVDTRRDAFAALNTAMFEDGAEVLIRRRAVVDRPIHILYVSAGSNGPIMIHPRNLIVAEPQSQAAVVEDYVSFGEGAAFSNAVTELVAGDDAIISHCLIERENYSSWNISTLRIEQGRGSNVASHSVLLGGGLVRNNVHPVLAGRGAECLINGLFIGGGRQHLDNYMLVEHVSPNGSSRQFYNGILDDQAHGVFHGRIIVHKDAQKTDANQTNRNLLLSDDARIDTKPQLEIHADDVKCTHGATIGQIDEDALFYLRSRGFSAISARRLLLYAFSRECLDRINQAPVRNIVESLIQQRLVDIAPATRYHAEPISQEQSLQNLEEVG